VGDNAHPYDPKAQWAQPNLTAAAHHMRSVFDDYSLAMKHAEQEKQLIIANQSLESAIRTLKPLIMT